MKKRVKIYSILKLLIISIFVLFQNACEYETDETYKPTNVNEDVAPPNIEIVELNITGDSIYLSENDDIKFEFKSDNQAIKFVRFSVDGIVKETIENHKGVFKLNGNYFPYASHTLLIEIVTGSGTNSLADELEVEGFVFSLSWVVLQ